jgi:hypothetical protein
LKKRIIIPYFPSGLKYATPLFAGVAVYLIITSHWILASLLLCFSVLILTTFYVTEIDLEKRRYIDFLSVMGIPFSRESTSFQKLDRIIITKENHVQQLNSRIQSRTLRWSQYTGKLIFDNGHTLDLVSRPEKVKLVAGVKDFALFLQVPIQDLTTPEQPWIFYPHEQLQR